MTYFPDFEKAYICCHCNGAVRLIDPDGTCDRYHNVVHKGCLRQSWVNIQRQEEEEARLADIRMREFGATYLGGI